MSRVPEREVKRGDWSSAPQFVLTNQGGGQACGGAVRFGEWSRRCRARRMLEGPDSKALEATDNMFVSALEKTDNMFVSALEKTDNMFVSALE
ncbi:hypothetical protein RRG08_031534 [Elysia crispata]|uniref:Uncharacterized protein n=1 Tax=Elysia crispata TaxID=231223 RepID=A0AAE1D9I5_9GAST|nr:hypothetical protein RRG08_031534 [Elysia crispata]